MVASATRSTWRPPAAKASSTPATGTTIDSTSRNPPVVVTASRAGAASGVGRLGASRSPGASARSVAEPVAWNSRSSSATARAVAEKATTIPVMTSACGTGSPPNPAAAPLRATTPKSRNTPLPSRLKARILRSGWGFTIRP